MPLLRNGVVLDDVLEELTQAMFRKNLEKTPDKDNYKELYASEKMKQAVQRTRQMCEAALGFVISSRCRPIVHPMELNLIKIPGSY